MAPRIRKLMADLAETFWLVPAILVAAGILGAFGLIRLDQSGLVSGSLRENWLYDGGATGARTLLGAVAGSMIAVAGTVFSITIAALSLAAGQMGPRLLRNFTRDRGNQVTLGALLGTFCYALVVLRSVRTEAEGAFVPHLSLSTGIGLAIGCVGMLVYFVGHMASRINVDTVVELVSDDLHLAIEHLTVDKPQPQPPADDFWAGARQITDPRRGYLQQLDEDGLATWAAEHQVAIRLLVGPGDYVFPGAPVALIKPPAKGVEEAIRNASALGSQRSSSSDLRVAVRQLVEVAVRALSSGINDPNTAISVLDRLGAALCQIASLYLPTGVSLREQRLVLIVPHVQYDQLLNTMFHMIRQSTTDHPAVAIRLLTVLAQVASCERDRARLAALSRHANLVLADARRTIQAPTDLEDVERRHQVFVKMSGTGPADAYTWSVAEAKACGLASASSTLST